MTALEMISDVKWRRSADSPRTRRRLDRMEPAREEAMTMYSPLFSAATERMSSTTFPKVAFSRPPTVDPNRTAKSSVTSPKSNAKGTKAQKLRMNVGVGPQCRNWDMMPRGAVISNRLSQLEKMSPPMAFTSVLNDHQPVCAHMQLGVAYTCH